MVIAITKRINNFKESPSVNHHENLDIYQGRRAYRASRCMERLLLLDTEGADEVEKGEATLGSDIDELEFEKESSSEKFNLMGIASSRIAQAHR